MRAPLKRVFAPHLGREVVFGWRPPVAPVPCLRFRDYLRGAALPPAPGSVSYTSSASASLSNIYGNDTLGDCVIAALFHLLGVWTGNASGTPYVATLEQIIAMYSAIGGYVPGDPSTDQGCDMETAMNWIVANGFPNGDRPLGRIAIDATNFVEVCTAIWLFEGIDLGMSLPDAWISPFPSGNGFTWDVAGAPNPQNGHSIMAAGYDQTDVTIDTWGLLGKLTMAALAEYAIARNGGVLYALLSLDMIAKGASKAPNGFDAATLISDFDAMGGSVPLPAPAPVPPPTPGVAPTLAQAEAWASSLIPSAHPLLTRPQAITLVQKGLAANWPKQ